MNTQVTFDAADMDNYNSTVELQTDGFEENDGAYLSIVSDDDRKDDCTVFIQSDNFMKVAKAFEEMAIRLRLAWVSLQKESSPKSVRRVLE